jgi:hypothetical protein
VGISRADNICFIFYKGVGMYKYVEVVGQLFSQYLLKYLVVFLSVFYKYFYEVSLRELPYAIYVGVIGLLGLLGAFSYVIDVNEKKTIDILNMRITKIIPVVFCIGLTLLDRDPNFLIPLILSVCFFSEKPQKLLSYFFSSNVICFSGVILLSLIGTIPPEDMYRIVDGVKIVRHGLGFPHPNLVGLFFLGIIISGYMLFRNQGNKYIVFMVIVIPVSVIIWRLTNSRGAFFCLLIVFALDIIMNKFPVYKIQISKYSFLFLMMISIGIATVFGKNYTNSINVLLSNRPYMWEYYIDNFGIPILPTELLSDPTLHTHGHFPVIRLDNYFIYLLMGMGIVLSSYLGYLYVSLGKSSIGRKTLWIACIVWQVYGLVEANIMVPSANLLITFLFINQLNREYFENLPSNRGVR